MPDPNLPTEVTAAAEREGFDASEYNLVATQARLTDIKLLKLRLDTDPDLLAEPGETTLAFDRQVQSCRYDPETASAAAIFQFGVGVRTTNGETFRCMADYAVLYEVPQGANAEAATSFCKHVGSFAAYPYFRAVAAQMAWNVGVDLPPLPSISAMPVARASAASGSDEGSSKPTSKVLKSRPGKPTK